MINNTGFGVIGNIVDTTVSDERLKTDMKTMRKNVATVLKMLNYINLNIKMKNTKIQTNTDL